MSVFQYIFDSDWSQRSDIESLREQTETLGKRLHRRKTTVEATETRVRELEHEVGELALICKTLMQTLLEKRVCTGQEIESLMQTIDAADGVVDGMVTKEQQEELKECPECHRPAQHHHTHCVYCGKAYPAKRQS